MNDVNAILLISCPDSKGIVAQISSFIYQHDGNIVHAAQHTSKDDKSFFMRVEWELNGFAIKREEISAAFAPLAEKLNMKWDLYFSDFVPRIAVFVSRHLHCLHDLILRQKMGEFNAKIEAVISNHTDARELAQQFGIKFYHYPIDKDNKDTQEEKELKLLQDLNIDLVVLARYMQILTNKFMACYPYKVINIHHSFLPAFAGGNPYQQAYDRGVKIIGATGHYATEKLDEGPIIAQDVIKISHRDEVADIQMKGKDLERIVLARALRLHLENKVLVCGAKTIVFE